MAFSPKIIEQVKQASAFRCCRCQSIGIEAHHIIPQKDHGPDTFENAAPLCPNCHSWFGDNSIKRKEITQMRNWWYERVKVMYASNTMNFTLLDEINAKVEALGLNQEKALIDLKEILKKTAFNAIDQMTADTARITASGIANATVSPSPSPSPSPEDQAGDGGNIFIISKSLFGGGNITADGGDGKNAGNGGEIQIESENNQFKGNISASGGNSKNKE